MYILYVCLEVSGRVDLGGKGRTMNRDQSMPFDELNRDGPQVLSVGS